MNYDLVLHVDKVDGSAQVAFTNAQNYAKALKGESFKMVLVVNSKAVTQFMATNKDLEPGLEAAVDAGLEIRLCQNALDGNKLEAGQIFPQCSIVPAGLVELVRLQREGYAYIKP